jgi:SAM-dependent methyltransferase
MTRTLGDRTIDDFGEQWTKYRRNDGYYGSSAFLTDVFGSLLDLQAVRGRRIAEIGAGTGRYIRIFLDRGAASVVAVEPSAAFDVLTAEISDPRLQCLRIRGDELPPTGDLDYVFSIGVLHHIPDPAPVVRAMFGALRKGGTAAIWVYGLEGNAAYLRFARPIRAVTMRMPHAVLAALVWLLYWPLLVWMTLSRVVALPLAGYMRRVFSKLTPDKRRLVLYDQLNPAYAKYYTRDEALALLTHAGFVDVRLYHRHGYSWSVVGTKPDEPVARRHH